MRGKEQGQATDAFLRGGGLRGGGDAEVRGGGGCKGGGRAAEGLVNGVKIKSNGTRSISLN